MLRKLSALLLILLVICFQTVLGQSNNIDFNNLRSDELSDQQIVELYQRMQDQGLTISQVEAIARARGVSPVEISKLKSRLNQVQFNTTSSNSENGSDNRLRKADQDQLARIKQQQLQNSAEGDTLDFFLKVDQKSRVFGADIFLNQNLTFEPSLNVPTPKNYKLGSGDEIIIDIWGAAENTYQLTITPDGTINIPNLGPVFLSGLTIEQASSRLIDKLASIYSGLKGANKNIYAQISLGRLRSIQVSIVGEVNFPGTFTLTSFSTVFNALYAAGGPNDNGTFRSIKILRDQKILETVDLYDFLVKGTLDDNITLQDQDIIRIDPVINRVTVEGETKRTGLFETIEGETIEDLISFTGGFGPEAYSNRILIERNTKTEKSVLDIKIPDEENTLIQNGDIVTVGKIIDRYTNRIEIEGAVYRPGFYQLEKNSTLSELIENAEGLRGDAYLERAIVYRTKPDFTIEAISVNLSELLNDSESNDITLQKDDRVKIASIFDLREQRSVHITGSVISPGSFEYVENITLKDLIFEAGGFKEEAAPYNIEIARRIIDSESGILSSQIAEIISVEIENGLSFDKELNETILLPFDQVFVRKSPAYEDQQLVTITGEVLYPGTYALSTRDFKLTDLIEKSGGTTEFAYIDGASLERKFDLDQKEISLNLEDSVTVQNVESLSKVGIKLQEALNRPGSEFNLLLQEGDVINIPKKLQTVQVRGEVLYPVNVRFDEGKSLKSYVNSAGGFTEDANKKSAYVVYANGEVDRTKRFLFFKSYPDVRPGSVIIIPPKKERTPMSTAEKITLYSTIVSMAAIVTNTIFQIRN